MAHFRKKPVVIEAMQYTVKPGGLGFLDLKHFIGEALVPYILDADDQTLGIETPDGWMLIMPGDWVIKGVNGEFSSCKPDSFAKTYELAESCST